MILYSTFGALVQNIRVISVNPRPEFKFVG